MLWLVAAAALSWGLSSLMRRYALRRAILDVPNVRSSHQRPTPRGGGVAIVGTTLLVTGVTTGLAFRWDLLAGLVGGGILVAGVGWVDDVRGVPAVPRAFVHSVAATWLVLWIGGLTDLTIGHKTLALGAVGPILSVVAVVWCTNLYNFMDGIDGLAAGEAALVGGWGAAVLWSAGSPVLALVSGAVSAASVGFLPWNWSPSRLFMGDVGSGFLGFVIAGVALASDHDGSVPFWWWALVMGMFVGDATVTLLRRVIQAQRWYAPHKSHAYQRLVQSGLSHQRVACLVLSGTVTLAGLASFAIEEPSTAVPASACGAAVIIAYYAWSMARWRRSTGPDG